MNGLFRSFKNNEETSTQIADVREKFLVKLYGKAIELDNFEDLRYRIFSIIVAKPECKLARLPSIRDTASTTNSKRTLKSRRGWEAKVSEVAFCMGMET